MTMDDFLSNFEGAKISFDPSRCNHLGKTEEECEACQRRKKQPIRWAMKYRPDGTIDPFSIQATAAECKTAFEADWGYSWSELEAAGWQCIKVRVVEVNDDETSSP